MSDGLDFAQKTHTLLKDHGALLLSLAKGSIIYTLEHGADPSPENLDNLPAALTARGACFVTLRKNEHLRGCIGSPEAWRPLATDVVRNANKAAFHDSRFGPLQKDESASLDIHISLLSSIHPFDFRNEVDFFAQLKPGTDGLVIEDLGCRALFLPSVWEHLPDAHHFVDHLKVKAGLEPQRWSATLKAWRFIAASTKADWDDISIPQ